MTPAEIQESPFRKDIDIIIDECASWFAQIVRAVFYPLQMSKKPVAKLEYYVGWIDEIEQRNLLNESTLDNLKILHNDLMVHTKVLLDESVKFQATPPYNDFERLIKLHEEFVQALKRLEKDSVIAQSGGVDSVTGMRDAHMFFDDARREMDRLVRQGISFCVVVARIDQFDDIEKYLGPVDIQDCLKVGARVIKKSLRSFDNAYKLEDGRFILSLKQTDIAGGIKSIHRIKRELEQNKFTYKIDGKDIDLTISGCIAEPVAEENLGNLLVNMQKDLDENAYKRSLALEYQELSPLQRFVKEGQ